MTDLEQKKLNQFKEQIRTDIQAQNPDSTPDEKEVLGKANRLWLKWKCLTDVYFLATEVLGWAKTREGKRRIDPKFHRWLVSILNKDGDKLILVPRDHMKSSWVKAKIVQEILNNPNIRILLASATKRLVVQELNDIKRMFGAPLLRRLFPEIIPDPGKDYNGWEKCTEQELTLRRDPELGYIPQGPQILAVGVGAKITGFHFEKAYLDDIIDEKSVTTVEQITKAIDWWGYLQPMLDTKSEITLIGTPYHYADLYAIIQREKLVDHIYKRPAIQNGKPIYRYFTLKTLARRKKQMRDEYKFMAQYMLDPTPTEAKIFPPPQPIIDGLPADTYKYYIAVDPAATTKVWSDHTGIVVGAVDPNNWLYIVEATKVKIPGNELADLLIRKVLQYDPVRVGIELGLQEHLRYIIDLKISDYNRKNHTNLKFPLMPIPISRTKSKVQRIAQSFGAFVREGRCRILSSCVDLLSEMEMYTGRESDEDNLVDAASMLFYCVENFAQHYWIEPNFRIGWTIENMFRKQTPTWEERFVQ